jgi:hypothetical protein
MKPGYRFLPCLCAILCGSVISCRIDNILPPGDGPNNDGGAGTGSLDVYVVHDAGSAVNTNSPIIIDLSDQITGAVLYTGKFTDNKPGLATLTEIAAGSYKLSIFHDVNNNAQRDASEPFADYASAITITANSKASATITLPEGTGSGDNVLNVDYHYTGSHGIDAGHPLVLSAKNLTAESNASHTCSAGDGTWQFTGLTDGVYGISIYYRRGIPSHGFRLRTAYNELPADILDSACRRGRRIYRLCGISIRRRLFHHECRP